jgi:hypothetical protein
LTEGSSGGRPGRREPRPRLLFSKGSVPSRQRVRADQEAPPPVSGQDPGRRCQEGAIGGGEPRPPPSSTTEDLQLVAEHGILQIQLIEAAADEQAEEATEEPVPDGPEHPGESDGGSVSWRTDRSECRSSFFTPNRSGVASRRELGRGPVRV